MTSAERSTGGDQQAALLALYDRALPQVYGYLLTRCGSAASAEDLDGLSVPEVADHLGRSVHAPETLLVRARGAFRRLYLEEESHGA